MSLVAIPTDSEPLYTETVTLDGTAFVLNFTWNQRAACWLLDLTTIDGEPVRSGVKLVCDWNLLLTCASPLRPPGQLLVISFTTDHSTPGLLDLDPTVPGGGRCMLVYAPAADVASILAGGVP